MGHELTNWTRGSDSRSPNRSDAIISAVTSLMFRLQLFRLQLLNRVSRPRGNAYDLAALRVTLGDGS
jgi:hypothetical protein